MRFAVFAERIFIFEKKEFSVVFFLTDSYN